jgi:probable HAF family extracellular repeat protein
MTRVASLLLVLCLFFPFASHTQDNSDGPTCAVAKKSYRFLSIDVPGAGFTVARGINDEGQISGVFSDAAGVDHGFLWSNDAFTPIDPPGSTGTSGGGINARADIVGDYSDQAGIDHGFLLRRGKFSTVDFPQEPNTACYAVNNALQIVGVYFDVQGMVHGT